MVCFCPAEPGIIKKVNRRASYCRKFSPGSTTFSFQTPLLPIIPMFRTVQPSRVAYWSIPAEPSSPAPKLNRVSHKI